MIKLSLRFTALLTIITVLLVVIMKVIIPAMPGRLGAMTAWGSNDNDDFGSIYLDLDTGIILEQLEVDGGFFQTIPIERVMVTIYEVGTPSRPYYFTRENGTISLERFGENGATVLGSYDGLYPSEAYWDSAYETLYVLDTGNLQDTTVQVIDRETGDMTALVTIEDFIVDAAEPSPDHRYILMRALRNRDSSSSGRDIYMVDVETGTVTDLGQPNSAYWSPDSRKIALGTISERDFMLDIHVYDLDTGETTDTGVQVSHADVDVFEGFARSGIKWTPDSSGLAVLNRYDEILHYVTLDGDYRSFTGHYLRPIAWSPDKHHMLVIGEDTDGQAGSLVINFENQTSVLLPDENTQFISVQGGVSWSPDGNYVMLSSWPGTNIYNLDGDIVREKVFADARLDLAPFPWSVTWVGNS